jgi:hypothetical protein
VSDFTVESFTPTLSYSAWWITGITVSFLVIVTLAALVALRPSVSKVREPEVNPVPIGVK